MPIDFQACDDDSILSDQGCLNQLPRPSHDAAVAAQGARTEGVSPPRKKAKHCLGPGLSRRGEAGKVVRFIRDVWNAWITFPHQCQQTGNA